MIATMFSQFVFFWWYTYLKELLMESKTEKKLDTHDHIMVTLISGIICVVASNPIWFVNTRIALSKTDDGIM